jgi:hypothetical protein
MGFEVKALPFASSGYYGSTWYGMAPLQVRTAIAKVAIQRWLTRPRDTNLRIRATAWIGDWFFGGSAGRPAGPWLGAGMERWQNRIALRGGGGSATFDNTVATLDGSYLWKFRGNLYLSPWVAVHHTVGGDDGAQAGSRTYHPPLANGEAPFKLGCHF